VSNCWPKHYGETLLTALLPTVDTEKRGKALRKSFINANVNAQKICEISKNLKSF
jgi:hypothetical protein